MNTRSILGLGFALVGVAGCSGGLGALDKVLHLEGSPGSPGVAFSPGDCPMRNESFGILRACMIDSNGKAYPQDGTLYVLPPAPPYGAYYQFRPGWTPAAEDVAVMGPQAAYSAFAAPYDVAGNPCCAEGNPANEVASHAVLADGGLVVTVPAAAPVGDQVAIALDFGALFKSRLTPCTLPDPASCQSAAQSGFMMRFYVGQAPSGTSPPDGGPPAPGSCLLSYNDALVSGDACCYRQGGKNSCDTSVSCNDRSGPGCCLIYGSESTAGGQRCCLYADGSYGDDADECRTLLAQSR